MTPLLNFSAGSISLIPQPTFKNTKKDIQLNKCNFRRTALLLPHPIFPLNWISTRSISKTRILTSAVEADVAVEADTNPEPETSEQTEPLSEQTEEAASTTPAVSVKQERPGMKKLPPVNKEDLVPGATFTGIVRSIQPFGIFVDVGTFTDGLVHISQISSGFIKDVKALFTVGQEVEVRLLEYNVQSGRISLTMRAPGDEKKEVSSGGTDTASGRGGRTRQDKRQPRYLEGYICLGKVTEITEEGAVVNFPGRVEGFLPKSEQVVGEGTEWGATLEVDQEIEVRILSVIEGEITLTMKEDEDVDKKLLALLERKKEGEDTFEVEPGKEFDALEEIDVEYEEEGEEGGNDAEVIDQAALENSSFDVDDTIFVNPFVSTFLRSRYAANAEKRLEIIGAVKKAGSIVAVSAGSVSEVAGGEVAVAGDGSEFGSVSIAEEQVALTEVQGGEAAAVGTASAADEPVAAASQVSASEVVSDSTVAETSNVATDSTTEASVAEPLAAGTSEAGESEVAAAEAVPEISRSEVSSEIGSVSVSEEPVVISEVEKSEIRAAEAVPEVAESEVTAAEAVPEVAESEVASESTVTEASTGTTELTTEAPPADEPASVTSEVTSEVEKSEVTAAEAVLEVAESEVTAAEAVPEVAESESEVASESTVTEASTGTTDLTTEAPPADEPASVTSEVTSEVEKSEVTAAEAAPEVAESEVASESIVTEASTGTTDLTTEALPADEPASVTSEVTSEVEKSEVTAAEAAPEVAESEVASESTVTEASTGTTDFTEAPPADEAVSVTSENLVSDSQTVLSENGASEIAASGKTEEDGSNKTEEAVSINVADEKTEVSEATPEASPTRVREVKATISPSLVKQLRDETGAGMMDCKKALAETNGDLAKAQEYLRKKGLASADKKASRATAEGRIGSYVHDGRIGVLIEVNCETDFVSRGDIFKELVEDIAMQVAACPQVTYLTSDEVPEETVQKEKEIEMQREDILSKPESICEKIVEGRIRKRLEEFALLEQPFIKDDKVVVKDYVKQKIATIGENIKVKRFVRFNLGEGLEKKSQDFAAEVAAQTATKPAATAEVAVAPPKDEKVETIETKEKAPAAAVTISPALVKALREETGAGMMDCKKALAETGGDIEKAQEFLRKKGLSSADKKSSRLAAEGLISAYIHDSRIGCLIEVNSETDFVARNEKFKELVNDLAMQVVACPQVEFVSVDEVPASVVEKEKAIEMEREDLQSKPEQIREKIVEGRISKRLGELALLEQPFIKDDSTTVKELVKRTIASLGENIKVRRFVRFTLGESTD